MLFLPLLALVAPIVSAINFTSPTLGETLSRGHTYDVTWTSVDTDEASFSIYLWNFVVFPPFYVSLGSVSTAAGSKEVTIPCDIASGGGYQFSAIDGSNVYVIDAQSPRFNIDDTVCTSPTIGTNPQGCPAAVTITASASTGPEHTTETSTATHTSVANGEGTTRTFYAHKTVTYYRTTVTETKAAHTVTKCGNLHRGSPQHRAQHGPGHYN